MRAVRYSVAVLLLMFWSLPAARALDTYEPYDRGASDFEWYLGFDGIGLGRYEKSLWLEAVAGYGLSDRFSALVTADLAGNEYFSGGEAGVVVGLLALVLDTDHVDLDIMLDIGYTEGDIEVSPGLELSFDLVPDQGLWGMYLHLHQAVYGRDVSTAAADDYELAGETRLAAGSYWTVVPGHQLLAEFGMRVAQNPAAGQQRVDIGGVALGYNAVLTDWLELITQGSLDIPGDGESLSGGLMLGFIATMP